jgi:hypothetical protein
VRDREKSKDFYVRILDGKVIKPENPCYIHRGLSSPSNMGVNCNSSQTLHGYFYCPLDVTLCRTNSWRTLTTAVVPRAIAAFWKVNAAPWRQSAERRNGAEPNDRLVAAYAVPVQILDQQRHRNGKIGTAK